MGTREVRHDVQGLRAVAVLAVIADHAGVRWLAGGYVGVDVFLVVSGFLITGLLLREADLTGRVSLRMFYARRARRILPAATVVLVAIAAWAAIDLSYVRAERTLTDVRWAAAFLANVHFARVGTDYFSVGLPPSPVQHYWSLAVEEQFYLVWPLVVVGLLVVARRRAVGSPHRLVTVALVAACAASLAWSVVQTGSDPVSAYFSSLARAWELGAGALLALVAGRLGGLSRPARHALALGGLVAVGIAVAAYDGRTPFPGYHALLPVLGTVAVLAAGTGADAVGAARLLTLRPLTWVGDLSYSLYLWHWPVLVLAAARLGRPTTPTETAGLLVGALVLSVASYHLVENPVRRSPRLRPPLRGLALWPVALVLVGCTVVGAHHVAAAELEGRIGDAQRWAALRDQSIPVGAEIDYSLRLADEGSPVAYPLTSVDEVEELQHDQWNQVYRCSASHDRSTAELCPVGDVDADRTMVLFGDSHAGEWLPALDRTAQREGYRLVPLVKFSCAPYPVDLVTDGRARDFTECTDFRSWALDTIADLRPDVVYLGARALPGNMVARGPAGDEAWRDGVAATLADLADLPSAPDVRILGDVGGLGFDPADCLTDPRATMRTCTAPEKARAVRGNRLTQQAADAAGVPWVPVARLACRHGRCPAFAGGRMLYADNSHLSVDWVDHVWPELDRMLRSVS